MKVKWTVVKLVCLVVVVVFVPSLRSCGDVSLGFPTVVYGDRDSEGYRFDVPDAILNAVVIASLALVLWRVYRRAKSAPAKKAVQTGLTGLLIYQGLILIGYIVLYPLVSAASERSLVGIIGTGYLLFIHPQFFIADALSDWIPRRWADSRFFGDVFDIPMRLGYLGMCAIWFGAGALIAAIRSARPGAQERTRAM